MEQTPIEKIISELKEQVKFPLSNRAGDHEKGERDFIESHILYLTSMLPYEKTYHRNIAEKAWGASIASTCEFKVPDRETYLNQNHPL